MLTNTKNTKINYQEKFSHILVGLLQYSEIYINNNNPSKIGAFLTIFKDFCNGLGLK